MSPEHSQPSLPTQATATTTRSADKNANVTEHNLVPFTQHHSALPQWTALMLGPKTPQAALLRCRHPPPTSCNHAGCACMWDTYTVMCRYTKAPLIGAGGQVMTRAKRSDIICCAHEHEHPPTTATHTQSRQAASYTHQAACYRTAQPAHSRRIAGIPHGNTIPQHDTAHGIPPTRSSLHACMHACMPGVQAYCTTIRTTAHPAK